MRSIDADRRNARALRALRSQTLLSATEVHRRCARSRTAQRRHRDERVAYRFCVLFPEHFLQALQIAVPFIIVQVRLNGGKLLKRGGKINVREKILYFFFRHAAVDQ